MNRASCIEHRAPYSGAAAEVGLDGVDDVDDVVAGALEVRDDVHVVDAGLILVDAVVDVLDVLRAERVAHVVDFALLVVGRDERALLHVLEVLELVDHHLHGLVDVAVHGVDVAVYFLVELGVALDLAVEDFAYAQTAVGD